MQNDFYDQVQTLRNTGNPFVIATVIRAEKPTSAKMGAKAIITKDGTLNGWIGGSCAEPTVKREAATVGAPAAIANAVVDALWHLGVRNIDIPITPRKVWEVLNKHGATLEE